MAIKRIGTLREEFDRAMDFEAVRTFKFDGKEFIPGQSFPKTLTSTRGLRQLYDSRRVRMVTPDEPMVREERPVHSFEIGNAIAKEPEVAPVRRQRVKLQRSA